MANDDDTVSQRLLELETAARAAISAEIADLSVFQRFALVIECCRVLDVYNVQHVFAPDHANKLTYPDLDLIARGWNAAISLLLPQCTDLGGVPFGASTTETSGYAFGFLHRLGCASLLGRFAALIRHGLGTGRVETDRIVLSMSERTAIDHFLDHVDAGDLAQLDEKLQSKDELDRLQDRALRKDIDERMRRLVFPWVTNRGVMTGYNAEPEVDDHFIALVAPMILQWRDEAGLHPQARLGAITGADLVSVAHLLVSFILKHIRFVMLGVEKYPEINPRMSLTIWKHPDELAESIASYTGMAKQTVLAALDLFTLRSGDMAYFDVEPAPFVPMLLKISENHLLSPVSSVFRNPLLAVRTILEQRSERVAISIRNPRENWMIDELVALFQGSRYVRIARTVRLKRGKSTVTDIDTAIYDTLTGHLALFQLKWQDFTTHDIRKQRSRAKNFVDQVDDWTTRVANWIVEFGHEGLCRALGLQGYDVEKSWLFAIGRSAARFQSYGYAPKSSETAIGTWRQFVKLRYEVGPQPNVFEALHQRLVTDRNRPLKRLPIRHEIVVCEQKILFEDLWSQIDDHAD
jgi:hypothetical protein